MAVDAPTQNLLLRRYGQGDVSESLLVGGPLGNRFAIVYAAHYAYSTRALGKFIIWH